MSFFEGFVNRARSADGVDKISCADEGLDGLSSRLASVGLGLDWHRYSTESKSSSRSRFMWLINVFDSGFAGDEVLNCGALIEVLVVVNDGIWLMGLVAAE